MLYYHRYPGVAQLVERVVWDHEAAGSRPVTRTTSEQSPLCSDVFLCLWQKKTSSARSLAPPFQLRPTSLGSQLVCRPAGGIFLYIEKYRFLPSLPAEYPDSWILRYFIPILVKQLVQWQTQIVCHCVFPEQHYVVTLSLE